MAQYSTKTPIQLKSDIAIIAKNLSPLIGCRNGDAKWSPYTAHRVCSAFAIVLNNVTDLPLISIPDSIGGHLTYNPVISNGAADIWRKVRAFSPDVLSMYYVPLVGKQIPSNSTPSEQLELAAYQSVFTDSTIFDSVFENQFIYQSQNYRIICSILLSAFALRYSLMTYTDDEINTLEVSNSAVDRTVEAIDYVKHSVSLLPWHTIVMSKTVEYISHHLNLLRKNLLMIKSNITYYVRS